MNLERMLDKEHKPAEPDIIDYLGTDAAVAWNDVVTFLAENYNFEPETIFGGQKYGWAVRYRRSGKTLCTLYPENGAFTILIVLGKQEVEEALARLNEFKPGVSDTISNARQYHDGRWLWLRILDRNDTDDVKRLVQIKKKPQKKRP